MKKKIIQGWGALRCRLGTCVERLQADLRKQLKVPFFGSFWMSIVFFACFLIYPPTFGITGSSITGYTPLRSVHPFSSFFAAPLRLFVCNLMIVACLLCIDWIMHTIYIHCLCVPSLVHIMYISTMFTVWFINQRLMYWNISLYTTTSLYNIRSVYLYICIKYIYIYTYYIHIYIFCILRYIYIYIDIRYMCILCIHRHHFPGRWGGAQSPEGHCLHGAAAFDVMGRTECINGGIVGINEWVYYHEILPLYIRNGYINDTLSSSIYADICIHTLH